MHPVLRHETLNRLGRKLHTATIGRHRPQPTALSALRFALPAYRLTLSPQRFPLCASPLPSCRHAPSTLEPSTISH